MSHAVCECGEEMVPHGACLFTHTSKTSRSRKIERIKYGDEPEDWGAEEGAPCHDCNVAPNTPHHVGCDAERCPSCGGQYISCGCGLNYVIKEVVSV